MTNMITKVTTPSAATTSGNPLLNAALSYAALGLYVFPCDEQGKAPHQIGGTNPETGRPYRLQWGRLATNDPKIIAAWWAKWPDANIGIPAKPNQWIVIDVDPEGLPTWADLIIERAIDDQTVTQNTPRGGCHVVYRAPADVTIGNRDLAAGINVRGFRGDGGYIVAAPSIHPDNGKIYQWATGYAPGEIEIAEMPEVLIDLLKPKSITRRIPTAPMLSPNVSSRHAAYAQAAFDQELAQLRETIIGTRNNTLNESAFSLGSLIGAGELDRVEVEGALLDTALSIGLSEGESRATIRSGIEAGIKKPRVIGDQRNGKYTAVDELLAADDPAIPLLSDQCELTDMGNARRLALRSIHHLRFLKAWGWLFWNGCYWQRDDIGEVMRSARVAVRAIFSEAQYAANEETAKKVGKWAVASQSRGRIEAMVALAESEPELIATPEQFDCDPMLLNCLNGTLDLRTGELRPHDPADLITKVAGAEYRSDATCPLWLSFLDRIMAGNAGLIGFLQRAIGYSLTGDTGEQVLFLNHGTGANGKSVLLETLRAMLGDYAMTAEFSTFLSRPNDSVRNDIARLAGARFVSAIEAGEGRRLSEVLIKSLTGGDMVTARFLFREFFTFCPQFKMWLATNHKPTIRGTDYAIWRRIRLIPFNVTLPVDERDPRLIQKLRAELPGILAWAVRGCLDWQREGLCAPAEVMTATQAYRAEMDALAGFLDDCCFTDPGAKVRAGELFTAYKAWCDSNNETAETSGGFKQRLIERGYSQVRANSGKEWRGIGLLAAGTPV